MSSPNTPLISHGVKLVLWFCTQLQRERSWLGSCVEEPGTDMSTTDNKKITNPFFQALKKQASRILKENLRTARLALTDVTTVELLAEESTNADPWVPDSRILGMISRAAFEVDDYSRIINILHMRLLKFDTKRWRGSYKALIVLEHLLTHGPESVASEFQGDGDVIRQMGCFQFVDESGFNWGMAVKKKTERIMELLQNGMLLKEERLRARKISRGIEGFGRICHRSTSMNGCLKGKNIGPYGRSNSLSIEPTWHEIHFPLSFNLHDHKLHVATEKGSQDIMENRDSKNIKLGQNSNLNIVLREDGEVHKLGELKSLLGDQKEEMRAEYPQEDHPFSTSGDLTCVSLLSIV